MDPRDRFDIFVVCLFGVALVFGEVGVSLSPDLLWALVDTLLHLDLTVYLVIGGALGVLFVGYIAVYLPRKQSENVPR